jgi:hypothetical protein
VDLLNHLARGDAATVWLSARSGMNIAPLRLAGIPMHPVSLAGRRLPRRAQDASLRAVQPWSATSLPATTSSCSCSGRSCAGV